MAFERNFTRFLFLFAIAQMFLCELAFTFQPNVIDAIATPLNSWLETGWGISTALLCTIAVFEWQKPTLFGESWPSHWKSVRTLTVVLVTIALLLEGAWFWFLGILQFSNIFTVTNFISLGFIGWILANAFGIAFSSQLHRLTSYKPDKLRSDAKEPFALEESKQAIEHLLSIQQKLEEQKWLAKIGEFSAQIAHDIRSPLAALNLASEGLQHVEEDRRILIRNAVGRINDIANQLLKKDQSNEPEIESDEPLLLISALDSLLSEKRMQFRSNMQIEIQGNLSGGYGLFSEIRASDFAQVLSNLINNSVEAMIDGRGTVNVTIAEKSNQIAIAIQDNGKGIPPEILARLGERGISHGKDGKKSGFGLGLYHARTTIERYQGQLLIQSENGRGTTITLLLPKSKTPEWFANILKISTKTSIVSLDDDQTIHQVWASRIRSELPNTIHISFSSIKDFSAGFANGFSNDTLFLIDYELLGECMNGLEIIQKYDIALSSILVTSRYSDEVVRETAKSMGTKILPKNLASYVQFSLEPERVDYHAVVIDDDSLVHAMWKMSARQKGKNILCFESEEEFETFESKIKRTSPIFIDVDLKNNVRGENVAIRVSKSGFKNIYLSTGYDKESIQMPAVVKRIINKEPYFEI